MCYYDLPPEEPSSGIKCYSPSVCNNLWSQNLNDTRLMGSITTQAQAFSVPSQPHLISALEHLIHPLATTYFLSFLANQCLIYENFTLHSY